MTKKNRYKGIVAWFEENVPVAETELHYDTPFHLLIAVILSAQCTDKRVNMVTPALFEAYPDPQTLAKASFDEVFPFVRSISYPNNKTVPDNIDDLIKLPGVGRKTANVVASIVYDKPVIAVDTHVSRVSRRLGLSDGKTPEAIGKELEANIDEDKRAIAHHWLILQGRYVCTARKPHCEECGLKVWCREYNRNLRKNELKI